MFTPPKTVAYEAEVAHCAARAMDGADPLDGPVAVEIEAIHGIPQSWSKKKQAAAVGGPVTAKPDIDNLIKSVADGANGVAWVDDKQIAKITARKIYGTEPGVRVRVSAM